MARDIFHDVVRHALEKDGWVVTHDPLILLSKAEGGLEVDPGAEKLITAEKGKEKIAVEVKSFVSPSIMYEFHTALGQYLIYHAALEMKNNNRELYLAIPNEIYKRVKKKEVLNRIIEQFSLKLIIFNAQKATIEEWKK